MICDISDGSYDKIRTESQYLADEYFEANNDTISIYWFPNDETVRLIAIGRDACKNEHGDNNLHPFYFTASPKDNLYFPSAVVEIRLEEFGKLNLPEGWGKWEDAVQLKPTIGNEIE